MEEAKGGCENPCHPLSADSRFQLSIHLLLSWRRGRDALGTAGKDAGAKDAGAKDAGAKDAGATNPVE
jgi:hypothetical protein